MAQMVGTILAILMCAVLNLRIRVPNSRSKEERLSEEDAQTSLPAAVEATFGEGSARIRFKKLKELQQEVGPFVNTGQVATEAEGLQLKMSAKSATGYLGVQKNGNYFQMNYKKKYIGTFATALEAAVAYAFATAAGGSAESARIRVKQLKELLQEVGPSSNTGQAASEAQGLQLHMSAKSATGYLGVHKHGNQFRVKHQAKFYGRFATALEAAVAYTAARAAGGSAEDDGDGAADTLLAPLQPHAQALRGNLSHVVLDAGSDTDLATTSKDVNDGYDGDSTDLISGSKDEDENLRIRAFPSQEAARASEQRLRQLKEVAKAVATVAANAAAKKSGGVVKHTRPKVSKPEVSKPKALWKALLEEARVAELALTAANALPGA